MTHLHIKGFFGPFRFMSNFVPCTVELDGVTYPSVEHAYVAAKTTNLERRAEIAQVSTAGKVKALGRQLKLREGWDEMRIDVMRDLLMQKFSQEPFKSQLLQTGLCYLEETNTWGDTFWGVCDGVGENHLGWLLMEIRDHLKELEAK